MHPIISFVSDFGLDDTWVGVCHAVIHRVCPDARIVDLAHNIDAFDIRKGAAVAAAGVHQLPEAIHLVVVDPGVGGPRRDLCVVTSDGVRLIGPDNGVLVPAARRAGGIRSVYSIEGARSDERPPLGTFHARDVLAPAAAMLACGASPDALGDSVDPASLHQAPFPPSHPEGDHLVAEILERDRFGSLRMSVDEADIETYGLRGAALELAIGHVVLSVPFGRSFSDVARGELVVLVDASGWLTLAENAGSAFERFGVEPGTLVRVRAL